MTLTTACAEVAPEDGAVQTEDRRAHHLVVARDAADTAALAVRVVALGGTVEHIYSELGVVGATGLDPAAAATLGGESAALGVAVDREVQFLERDESPIVAAAGDGSSLAPDLPLQWHLTTIGADVAWKGGVVGDRGVKVAVLDTGVDPTHPDLAGLVDLTHSVSFVPSDDALVAKNFPTAHVVTDLHFHGTHVAATLASNGKIAAGVASNITIIGVKVLGVSGRGSFGGILEGIMYATKSGANVINMSLGTKIPREGTALLRLAIKRAISFAHKKGALVVVAAGNDSTDLDADPENFHAFCDTDALCVSATGPTAAATMRGPFVDVDAVAEYSNYGKSVAMSAPGGAAAPVWAACSRTSLVLDACRTGAAKIVGLRGTSMAAPHVAGAAALLAGQYGREPAAIRERLESTASDLGQAGRDVNYGAGRLDIARALGLR